MRHLMRFWRTTTSYNTGSVVRSLQTADNHLTLVQDAKPVEKKHTQMQLCDWLAKVIGRFVKALLSILSNLVPNPTKIDIKRVSQPKKDPLAGLQFQYLPKELTEA